VPWYDLIKDPGRGNLNLRALVASLLGPRRVAHGQRRTIRVPNVQAAEIARNAVQGDEVMYVEVWLPPQVLAAGARVHFSSSESMGETAVLQLFAGIEDKYEAVLLPREQLFAQVLADAAGNPAGPHTPLVVSTVAF
jgi:hypothetical protein